MIGYQFDFDFDQSTEFFNDLRADLIAFKILIVQIDDNMRHIIWRGPNFNIDDLVQQYYTYNTLNGYIEFDCQRDAVMFKLKYM